MKSLRTPTARAVANVLAGARKEKGLTQQQLANLVKRPQSLIGSIEAHSRRVDVAEFITLAEKLGRDPEELFRQVLRERRR